MTIFKQKNTINRIIFFMEIPFCKRNYDRLGIKTLLENGFQVEYWNFTSLLHPKFFSEAEIPDLYFFDKHFVFSSFKEIQRSIFNLAKDCLIISCIPYTLQSYEIYKSISKKKLRFWIFRATGSSHPHVASRVVDTHDIIHKMKRRLKKLTQPASVKDYIFRHTPFTFLGIKPAELILAGGAKTDFRNCSLPINFNTKILWIHRLDYDIYLEESKKTFKIDEKLGVFLDEYLPFHPDWSYCNVASPILPNDYYPYLCNFFDHIEKSFGTKIIIAAHPRSQYEKHEDYFGGREVIRGETARLVKKSHFVIAHSSHSVNFAVLFKKPIIFITTNKLNLTFMKYLIESLGEILGKQANNINSNVSIDFEKELYIDEHKYNLYRNNYIKKVGTEELPFWQIVANRIKQFQ